MEHFDIADTISYFVRGNRKRGVYIANHLNFEEPIDQRIWQRLINEITIKYPDTHNNILNNLLDKQLFIFSSKKKAVEFYKCFNVKEVYNSGLYAELIDKEGNIVCENT